VENVAIYLHLTHPSIFYILEFPAISLSANPKKEQKSTPQPVKWRTPDENNANQKRTKTKLAFASSELLDLSTTSLSLSFLSNMPPE
jgi:hypothetical protein